MVPAEMDVVEAAIVELARPGGPIDLDVVTSALDHPDAARLHDAVEQHRLVAPLVDVLTRVGRTVPAPLAAVVDDDRLTRLKVGAVLSRAAGALDAAGLAWVTMKGPVIASLMARPELRAYNDLDLLVRADDFGPAMDVLAGVGVEELNENWQPYIDHLVGEVPLVAMEVTVDLHWHLVGLAHVRATMRVDPEAMLERRVRRMLGDTDVAVFDAEDRMLHLAVHCGLAGATRLTQLRDLAVVASHPLDWDVFAARARAAGVARLVTQPLDRARLLFDPGIPEEVITGLGGRSVALRRRLDGPRPSQWRSAVVNVSRDGRRSTARALSSRLRERLRRSRRAGVRGWDFTDANGRLYHATPSGGPDGRARYLDAIRHS